MLIVIIKMALFLSAMSGIVILTGRSVMSLLLSIVSIAIGGFALFGI